MRGLCYRHGTYTRPNSRATLVAPGTVGHRSGRLAAQSLYILPAYRYFTNNLRFKFRENPLGMDPRDVWSSIARVSLHIFRLPQLVVDKGPTVQL